MPWPEPIIRAACIGTLHLFYAQANRRRWSSVVQHCQRLEVVQQQLTRTGEVLSVAEGEWKSFEAQSGGHTTSEVAGLTSLF
jgi:hypothetical protein